MMNIDELRTARAQGLRPVAPEADLRGADLRGADLRGADLRGANLWGANLRRASLRGADLGEANLWGANLRGADLGEANLRGANLRGANQVLQLRGMPSGELILWPTPEGWSLVVGCWQGSTDDLRALIAKDDGWPEATAAEIPERRAYLEAALTLCDLHMKRHADVIPALVEKWGKR